MSISNRFIFILCFILLMLTYKTRPVSCLSCVQCDSLVDKNRNCFERGHYEPTPCANNETYCLKFYAYIPNSDQEIILRKCGKSSQINACDDKGVEVDQYVHCYYSCNSDGCNHSTSSAHISTITPIFSILLATCFINNKVFLNLI